MSTIGISIDEQRIEGNLGRLRQDLSYLSDRHFDAVELPVQGLDVIRHGKIDRRILKEVVSLLADFPFRYSVHAPHALNLMDTRDRRIQIDVLRASLAFASEIGATELVYHPGKYVPEELFFLGQPMRRSKERQKYLLGVEAEAIREISADFPHTLICMENLPPYLFHSPYCYAEFPEFLKEQIERIDRPNVRMTVDFGHLFLASRFYDFDPVQLLKEVGALIGHVHVHDNFGAPVYYNETGQSRLAPFGRGDCHMPVGWGRIPIRDFLAAFVLDYEGILVLEMGKYLEHGVESRALVRSMCAEIALAPSKTDGKEERVA